STSNSDGRAARRECFDEHSLECGPVRDTHWSSAPRDRCRGTTRPGGRHNRCEARRARNTGAGRGTAVGAVCDRVRWGAGKREEGEVMTERDRRALVVGGAVTVAAALVLRVLPWGARSVLAERRHLDDRAALLARARAA